jgi:ATP-dependent RNA helicase DeaD
MLPTVPNRATRPTRTAPGQSAQNQPGREADRRTERDGDTWGRNRRRDERRPGFGQWPPRGPRPQAAPTPAVRPAPAAPAFAAASADEAAPKPAASFAEMTLRPATFAAVAAMGITNPTPIQSQAIPAMLSGRDVVGQARTGSGKTLAFGIPIVERCDPAARGVQALVLVPTRELAIQVGEVIGRLAEARRLRLTLLYGGRSLVPEARALAGGPQIVVGTPGRTLDHLRQRKLSLQGLRLFVLDEGDEMLDRGFAPDVERILAATPATRQTALFSATVPAWVMETAARHLRRPVTVRVDPTVDAPPEIEHVVYEVDAATRMDALCTLLDRRGEGSVIVFGRTKHGVKKLGQKLEKMGYPVGALQGNLSQNARERVMAAFRSGETPILLATNVAARGLDVDDVAQVINFELPESSQLFTHRVGRTGRMGRQGEAITFIAPEDAAKRRQIERALGRTLPRRRWLSDGTAQAAPVAAPVARTERAVRAPAPARTGDQQPRPVTSRRWNPRHRRPRP